MPQLDTSTFCSQIFWFLFFFSLLFFVITYLFMPELDKMIIIRSGRALDSFNTSLNLLRLIEDQTAKYNEVICTTRIEAKKIIDNALIKAEEIKNSAKVILEEEEKKISELVKEQIEKFKSEYACELKQMATGIALIYCSKLTNFEIGEKFVAGLVSKEF